jgi:3-hydroxyisobutyrate dehydrogenase-like beta-hydroxyacid dehydrogenase
MTTNIPNSIAFIGFGEAGQAIAAGLREAGVNTVAAWDILFVDSAGDKLKQAARGIGARVASSPADAVANAEVIISAVTAASSLEAARSVQEHLTTKPFFLDINSVSPGTKQETEHFLGARARYVDVAVMGPIHPARHQTPMLICGPYSAAIEPILQQWGMRISILGTDTGAAAAIKMVRSVMIKGIEALTLECFLAASRAGVEDHVIASLTETFPTLDWPKLIEYNLERMARHGTRRAAEMEEVAKTLAELGVDPLMVDATVKRQREMGRLGKENAVKDAVAQGRLAALREISAAAKNRH